MYKNLYKTCGGLSQLVWGVGAGRAGEGGVEEIGAKAPDGFPAGG